MKLISIFLFAVALSFDGFGAGIAYGIKKIRIPLKSLLIICVIQSTVLGLSMLLGTGITKIVSSLAAERIGAIILVIMGGWLLVQSLLPQGELNKEKSLAYPDLYEGLDVSVLQLEKPLFRVQIKPLGLVIQIIRQPVKADLDNSGAINPKEAIFLGVALAMDALGAGIGASLAGFPIIFAVPIVGTVEFILISFGGFVGRKFSATWLGNWASVIPGCVLILLGLANFQL